jgi:hypothetical protein
LKGGRILDPLCPLPAPLLLDSNRLDCECRCNLDIDLLAGHGAFDPSARSPHASATPALLPNSDDWPVLGGCVGHWLAHGSSGVFYLIGALATIVGLQVIIGEIRSQLDDALAPYP